MDPQDPQYRPISRSSGLYNVSQPAVPPAAPEGSNRLPSGFRLPVWLLVALPLMLVATVAAAFLFQSDKSQTSSLSDAKNDYIVTSIPLSGLGSAGALSVDASQQLTINGELRANNGLVVTPSSRQNNPVAGQLYYDKTQNILYYYNGTQFVAMTSAPAQTSVGGLTGNIGLGPGLGSAGANLVNTGVLTVQGQAGNVTFLAGNGIAINGQTISSTITQTAQGITGINGTNGLGVSQAGSTVTLSLPQDLTTGGSPTFAGLQLSVPLGVASGGTGATAFTANGLIIGNGTGALSSLGTGSSGQCLLSNGAGAPSFQACPSGSGGNISSGTSQTAGRITKFDTAFGTITDSLIAEAGTVITINGDISVTGTANGNGSGLTNVNAAQLGGQTGGFYQDAGNINAGTLSNARLSNSVTLQGNVFNGASQLVQLDLSARLPAVDASLLTNLNGSAISTGTISDTRLSSNVGFLNATQTFTGANTFSNASNSFTGSGSGLTGLNASNVSSGTLNDARLSTNVTLQGNAFNGSSQLVQTTAAGALPVISGVNLTNLNASNLASGTVNDARLSSNVTIQGNTFNGAGQLVQLNGSTQLPAVSGLLLINLNASNINTGTLSILYGGTGANDATTARSNLSAAKSGANSDITSLTALTSINPGSGLTIGNTAQSLILQGSTTTLSTTAGGFTATLGFAAPSANQTITIPNASGTVCLDSGNCLGGAGGGANTALSNLSGVAINTSLLPGTTGSVDLGSNTKAFRDLYVADSSAAFAFRFTGAALTQNKTITVPSFTGTTATLCLSTGNCAGSGSSVTTGGGTQYTIAMFSGSQSIDNSILSQDAGGTVVTVGGNLTVNGTTASTAFSGDGASLTNLNASSLASGTVNDARLSSNVPLKNATQTFTGANTFSNASNSFTGNGSGLTSLNASNVSSGTLNDARLSSNVALLNANQTFSGANNFSQGVGITSDAGTASSGLLFGSTADTNLYRLSAGILQTDSSFYSNGGSILAFNGNNFTEIEAGGRLHVGTTLPTSEILNASVDGEALTRFTIDAAGKMVWGDGTNPQDTNLYRVSADTLKTDDNFEVSGSLVVGTLGGAGSTALCLNGSNQIATCSSGGSTVSLQQAYNDSTSPEITLDLTRGALTIRDASTPLGANLLEVQNNAGSTTYLAVSATGTTVTGTLSASSDINTNGVLKVNGSQISSANLSNDANLAKINAANTFTGTSNTFNNVVNANGGIATAGGNINAGSGTISSGAINGQTISSTANFTGTVTVQGNTTISNLTGSGTRAVCANGSNVLVSCGVNANGVTLQQAYDASANPEITVDATRGALTVRDASSAIGANLLEVQNNAGTVTYFGVTSSGVSVTGTATFSSTVNSSGGAIQTAGVDRISNAGNLVNIGSLTLSGAISGGTTYSGSGNINTTGGGLQTNSVTRVDNSGNLTNIGNINGASAVILAAGGTNQNLTLQSSGTGSVIAKPGTDSTAAFQVQNAAGNSLFTADTSGAIISSSAVFKAMGGLQVSSLSAPAAPSVTPMGVTGATTYSYTVTARNANGGETTASSAGTTNTGNATLSGANFNRITWTAVAGAADYRVYRTVGGATQGLIGTSTTATFDDTGLAGSGSAPTLNKSGYTGLGNGSPGTRLDVSGAVTLRGTDSTQVGVSQSNQGIIVFDSTDNKFKVSENGSAYKELCNKVDLGCGTGGSSLQAAYTAGAAGDQTIALSAANDSIILQNPSSGGSNSGTAVLKIDQLSTGSIEGLRVESAGTGNLFTVRDTTATAKDVFKIADGGATTLQNQTDSAAAFQIQNSVGTPLFTADTTNGQIKVQGLTTSATIGSELFSAGSCTGTNWTGTGPWTHTTGSTVALSCTPPASVTAGALYQVSFDVTGSPTSGEKITPNVGNVSGSGVSGNVTSQQQVIQASTTANLIFTPTSNWNGNITNISIKLVTPALSAVTIQNSDGTTGTELRAGGSGKASTFLGVGAGQSNTTGTNNVGVGNFALQGNTTGVGNTAVGYTALSGNTTGQYNSALGYGSQAGNTTGAGNTSFGAFSLQNNPSSNFNTAVGYQSLQLTTGSGNSAFGQNSLNNNTTGNNNTALGNSTLQTNTTGSSNTGLGRLTNVIYGNQSNSTAVGAQATVGSSNTLVLGRNTDQTVIGNSYSNSTSNLLQASSQNYATGTISQSGNTITGTGTTFTAGMVGGTLYYTDGTSTTVTGYTSATSITVASSSGPSGSYHIIWGGFNVSSTGSASLQNTTDSTTALQVKNAAGTSQLTVDTQNSVVKTTSIKPITAAMLAQNVAKTTIASPSGGTNTTMAIGSDGYVRATFIDSSSNSLHFVRCNDNSCSSPTLTLLDSTPQAQYKTIMKIAADGFARILYPHVNGANNEVIYIQCTDADCTSPISTTISTSGGTFGLELGSDNFGRIVAIDSGSMKFFRCTNASCTTRNAHTIAVANDASMALGSDGFARITYSDNTDIRYVHCTNADCSTSNDNIAVAGMGIYTTTTVLASDDTARIMTGYDFYQCTNADCTSKNTSPFAVSTSVTSAHMGADGFIRFTGATLTLFESSLYICNDAACSSPARYSYDASSLGGFDTQLALGQDGYYRIVSTNFAMTSGSGGELQYYRLSSATGQETLNGPSLGDSTSNFGGVYAKSLTLQGGVKIDNSGRVADAAVDVSGGGTYFKGRNTAGQANIIFNDTGSTFLYGDLPSNYSALAVNSSGVEANSSSAATAFKVIQSGSGNTLEVQAAGLNALTVDNNGNTTINNAVIHNLFDNSIEFQVQSANSTPLLTVDATTLTVTVLELAVSNNLTVNGHLITGGISVSATVGANAGTGATCTVSGNDTAGTLTLNTGTGTTAGLMCTINFVAAFGSAPRVVLTPAGINAADSTKIKPYVSSATNAFTLNAVAAPTASTTYTFNYFAPQ